METIRILAWAFLALGVGCIAYVIWCFKTYRDHRTSCLWAMFQAVPALVASAIFFAGGL